MNELSIYQYNFFPFVSDRIKQKMGRTRDKYDKM